MPSQFNPLSTSVQEIHEIICDTAVNFANDALVNERIPNKWKGPVFRNDAPYNEGRLSLVIAEEYQSAPDRVKLAYRRIGRQAITRAIAQHQDIFAGMIFGEARAGRNYFEHWGQAPERLF